MALVTALKDDKEYPQKARSGIESIGPLKKLEGSLDIKGFFDLKELKLSHNKLTSLSISNCPQLAKLDCSDNQLTSLDFLDFLNPNNLIYLDISGNNFSDSGFLITAVESCKE